MISSVGPAEQANLTIGEMSQLRSSVTVKARLSASARAPASCDYPMGRVPMLVVVVCCCCCFFVVWFCVFALWISFFEV